MWANLAGLTMRWGSGALPRVPVRNARQAGCKSHWQRVRAAASASVGGGQDAEGSPPAKGQPAAGVRTGTFTSQAMAGSVPTC